MDRGGTQIEEEVCVGGGRGGRRGRLCEERR